MTTIREIKDLLAQVNDLQDKISWASKREVGGVTKTYLAASYRKQGAVASTLRELVDLLED